MCACVCVSVYTCPCLGYLCIYVYLCVPVYTWDTCACVCTCIYLSIAVASLDCMWTPGWRGGVLADKIANLIKEMLPFSQETCVQLCASLRRYEIWHVYWVTAGSYAADPLSGRAEAFHCEASCGNPEGEVTGYSTVAVDILFPNLELLQQGRASMFVIMCCKQGLVSVVWIFVVSLAVSMQKDRKF